MPLKIDRTPRAKRDIFALWDYVAPESLKGAERLVRRVDELLIMLAENPQAGRASPTAGGVRYFPFDSYLIFYRYTDTTLVVLRILHAARDISPDLLGE